MGDLPLLPRLLSQPLVEHRPREADVPADSPARQSTSPYRLIDPTRLDVQIPRRLVWAEQPVIDQSRRGLCCRRWSLHTTI
jgi:hypothetical protein